MGQCYSDDSLRRLGDDDLAPAVYEEMEKHVQECRRCGSRLESLARECRSLAGRGAPEESVEAGADRSEETSSVLELDDFLIEREIGRGAMGVVHLARDLRLERWVALKVLSQPGCDARRRWLREARAVSSVRHSNVVSLYDCREVGPWLILVLEYIPGGSLQKRISGPLDPRAAAVLMEKIARAVSYIHGQGVLHLDLKPSNILLDGEVGAAWERTIPLIADFGLAVFHEAPRGTEPTQDGPRGTPSYMAPEQMAERQGKLGPAADLYSLGVVLYELLTGRPPFRAASPYETMELACTQDPVPLRRLNPRAPRDLETIVHKCLQKDPERRYETAEAMADDLHRWLEGHPIKARPATLAERAWRVCRRHRAASFLCLALVATAAISFGLLLEAFARADAARQAAEQNFEIASTVTERLEDVVLDALNSQGPIDERRLESAARLLREQVRRGRAGRGFNVGVLSRLCAIDERLACWHLDTHQWAEALPLAIEQYELASECMAAEPGNIGDAQRCATALHLAALAEVQGERLSSAIDYLDRASEVVRNSSPPLPDQLWRVWYYSYLYLGARRTLVQQGRVEEARRAFGGHLRMWEFLDDLEPPRPARSLYLACMRADRGEVERARGQAAAAIDGLLGQPGDSDCNREELVTAVQVWFFRVPEVWIQECLKDSLDGKAVQKVVEGHVARMNRVCRALEINPPSYVLTDALCVEAASQRRLGRIDEAERIAAALFAFANSFAAAYPDRAVSYRMLSEAFIQQSKNAWKRDDKPAIRDGASRAVEALEKAARLAPNDYGIQARLAVNKARLDALPPAP